LYTVLLLLLAERLHMASAVIFVWALSIHLYAAAANALGPGGAMFIRGVVFLTSLYLGRGGPVCKVLRLVAGGLIDTFIGFGSYTLAVSLGDYVSVTLVVSTYPLVTTVAERPFRWRKVLGALLAVAGLALATG
jgi:drug/metabolite transporter (DMT)-like permease